MFPIVLGTAGHIDHGKTSLVRALTGIDTDRLPVEKARGITTELGFARLDLGERRVAVVDVPGHERFVKSMVAGATGIDVVMLVIAADEGVMPQTREHLDICDLLGVRRGLIVLTKRDLVDDEWLGMVTGDVTAAVAGTFLDGAPVVPVSTHTPPTQRAFSMTATRLPILAACTAARWPAGPLPMATRSKSNIVRHGHVARGALRYHDYGTTIPRRRHFLVEDRMAQEPRP